MSPLALVYQVWSTSVDAFIVPLQTDRRTHMQQLQYLLHLCTEACR